MASEKNQFLLRPTAKAQPRQCRKGANHAQPAAGRGDHGKFHFRLWGRRRTRERCPHRPHPHPLRRVGDHLGQHERRRHGDVQLERDLGGLVRDCGSARHPALRRHARSVRRAQRSRSARSGDVHGARGLRQ